MKVKRVEHIAIAVDSLRQSIDFLGKTFGLPLEYEEQIGQTRLAMLPVGETYLELLEGQGPESGVSKWIGEKGPGLFHICFEVEDIDGALAELKDKGVKLRDETPRIGHGGARIAFIDPSATGNVLIELASCPRATARPPEHPALPSCPLEEVPRVRLFEGEGAKRRAGSRSWVRRALAGDPEGQCAGGR